MGPYLSQPKKEKTSFTGQGTKFIYACSEMQGWRNTMEDAAIARCDLTPDVSLFAVFDGHGGKEVAYFAEKHFAEELLKNKNFSALNFELALKETFLKIDELILTPAGQREINSIKGGHDDETSYAGCTANVALFYKNTLYVANAGDSRAVLCRNDQPENMSFDHKPDNTDERNRIEKAGGFIQDGRVNANLNLSRALGDMEYKRNKGLQCHEQLIIAVPDIKKIQLGNSDKFLLMGCDGVFETLNHSQLLNFINEQMKGKQVNEENIRITAENLLDKLLAPDTSNGTGCDNMTTIIIYLK